MGGTLNCRHSTLWFKRQIRRRLREATRAYCELHRVTLTLWALYRKGFDLLDYQRWKSDQVDMQNVQERIP